jgi:hypothetical protein
MLGEGGVFLAKPSKDVMAAILPSTQASYHFTFFFLFIEFV